MPGQLPTAAVAAGRRLLCTTTAGDLPGTHLLSLLPVEPSPTADELARLLLAHRNPFHPAESPLEILSGGGVSLTTGLLVQLLLRLRGASKPALLLLHAARLHPSVVRCRVAARRRGRGRRRRHAPHVCGARAEVTAKVFNKRKYKYGLNEKMYTILIYGWCNVNRNDMAQKFLKDMIDHGLEPNIVTYNILLNEMERGMPVLHGNDRERISSPECLTFETLNRGLIQADMLRTWRRLKRRVDEAAAKFGEEFRPYHIKPYK
ncbi:hypothetical protein ABZP36_008980 [Zizania latifolia]